MQLSIGRVVADVPDDLVALAGETGHFGLFTAPADATFSYSVRRAPGVTGAALTAEARTLAQLSVRQSVVEYDGVTDGLSALAVLRAVWHVLIVRQGGLLVHASGVEAGGSAVLAVGVSGAGKSTLARLAVDAGATLLSDEIIAVFPDGRAVGTPFLSDLPLPSSPTAGRIVAVLALEKAETNAFVKEPSNAALSLCMAQTFRPEGLGLSPADALARWTSALKSTRTLRYRFRKEADAGVFLLQRMREDRWS